MREISTNPACSEFVITYALTDIDKFHSENDGSRGADLRKAETLMFLARNEVISKCVTGTRLSDVGAYPLGADADTGQCAGKESLDM